MKWKLIFRKNRLQYVKLNLVHNVGGFLLLSPIVLKLVNNANDTIFAWNIQSMPNEFTCVFYTNTHTPTALWKSRTGTRSRSEAKFINIRSNGRYSCKIVDWKAEYNVWYWT
jgi:CRISPR/Cas system endoribonuclease Cas6 (RAMP superfamily)